MNHRPDIIGLPVYTGWQGGALSFAKTIKEKLGIPVVLGGPHPTYHPEILESPYVDYICVGEGEIAVPKFLSELAENNGTISTPGIWSKNGSEIIRTGPGEIADLNDLPDPDFGVYFDNNPKLNKMSHFEFNINRGCMFKCSYCVNRSLNRLYKGSALRSKSPHRVINEIKKAKAKYSFSAITFVNDTLFINKKELMVFLDLYKKEIDLPFYCNLRVEMITRDIAQALAKAGCTFVAIGVESGSPRVRSEILNRHMSNEKILEGVRLLKEAGIGVNANSMVGIPGESFEEALETVELIRECNPTTTWCSIFQPYPGTDMTNQLIESGDITTDIFDNIPPSFFDKSVLPIVGIHQFVNLQRLFYLFVKYPSLSPVFKAMCKFKVGRAYDIFFLFSFYKYLKAAHKETTMTAINIMVKNIWAALKNS